jgi:hypothetical protein
MQLNRTSRLGYDYDGRYIFSASVRRDGSSKFAAAKNGVISGQ